MSTPRTYPCRCCGYRTLTDIPPGTYQVCQVCYWEDDRVQYDEPHCRGGANDVSIDEARQKIRNYGWASERDKEYIRPPQEAEYPSNSPSESCRSSSLRRPPYRQSTERLSYTVAR